MEEIVSYYLCTQNEKDHQKQRPIVKRLLTSAITADEAEAVNDVDRAKGNVEFAINSA